MLSSLIKSFQANKCDTFNPASMIPPSQLPRISCAADFANLRRFLVTADYCESSIASRLHSPDSEPLDLITLGSLSLSDGAERDVLDLLIRVFLRGECTSKEQLASLIPSPILESVGNLGLLNTDPADATRIFAGVALYPMG